MNLAEIETFLMIVKTKNITKTAENLFLSQPTVSHRLKLLEEELDVRLISRKKGYNRLNLLHREKNLSLSQNAGFLSGRRCRSLRPGRTSCT